MSYYDDLWEMDMDAAVQSIIDEFNDLYITDKTYRKKGERYQACVSRKIEIIYHEERKKPKGKRRSRKQIIAMSHEMCGR